MCKVRRRPALGGEEHNRGVALCLDEGGERPVEARLLATAGKGTRRVMRAVAGGGGYAGRHEVMCGHGRPGEAYMRVR